MVEEITLAGHLPKHVCDEATVVPLFVAAYVLVGSALHLLKIQLLLNLRGERGGSILAAGLLGAILAMTKIIACTQRQSQFINAT